jgi:hypothetical protein
MKYIVILFLSATVACQQGAIQNESLPSNIPSITNKEQIHSESTQEQTDEYEPENFADENKIGKQKQNRVEVSTYKKGESLFVKTKFYAKSKSKWVLKNEFDVEKFGELPIQPEIKDFNGDGFNDITFVSDIAARGANDVRNLFIYDLQKDQLIHIKNSSDYPNLGYNPLLKCLDALIFTGSTTTVFLKLKDDKLVEFASVEDSGTERTIYIVDRKGKKKLLRSETRKDDGFYRYINFDPVQIYQD